MAQPVYWVGSLSPECQLCDGPYNGIMYDSNIRVAPHRRSWGNWCQKCHADHGGMLGTGLGQKYAQQEDGKWLKVAG